MSNEQNKKNEKNQKNKKKINTDFWPPVQEFKYQERQNPLRKKKREVVIENMLTAKEKADKERTIAAEQVAIKNTAATKKTIALLLSMQQEEKFASLDSNTSLLNLKIPPSLQSLLSLKFPLAEEASNALFLQLKTETDAILEPLLLREDTYSDHDEASSDNEMSTAFIRSEATITEFTITEFRQQEKKLKTTFETFWKNNRLGVFLSETLNLCHVVPSYFNTADAWQDFDTCSRTLEKRIGEINSLLKDWEESKKMLLRPDPTLDERQIKLIALKKKLIFIKKQVDDLMKHASFHWLYKASRQILLAEGNHFMARLRCEAEERAKKKQQATDMVEEVAYENDADEAIAVPFKSETLLSFEGIDVAYPNERVWLRFIPFFTAFISNCLSDRTPYRVVGT